MARYAVRANKQADGLTLHISGHDIAHANVDLLNDCVSQLLACAEKNECFTKGLNVNCLATIAEHNKRCDCVSQAFGLAR